MPSTEKTKFDEVLPLADRLHSACIHILRRVRKIDEQAGLSAPKMSVLSVLIFAGPKTLGQLAAAEQVKPPTMTRLVQELEKSGYVSRRNDSTDRRVVHLRATAKAERVLRAGRSRRARMIAQWISTLSPGERMRLSRALPALEKLPRVAASA